MYLLEHDAKELLAQHGIPVPPGRLLDGDETIYRPALPPGPWIVKGQINTGGRGKAGIIRKADTLQEIVNHTYSILGATVKDRRVNSIRIEQRIDAAEECYLALMVDPAAAGVRVIMSAQGGMEIEAAPPDLVKSEIAQPDYAALAACVQRLAAGMPGAKAQALREAGERLARVFLDNELMLAEINPLFVKTDGGWIAGDAKIVTDDNALVRQPALRDLLEQRATAYPEAALKLNHGFDYVVVDPQGEIGLLTTGAGLSMMLIDELRASGLRPYNFLDIRTGGLRGETKRLVQVLHWIARGRNIRVLLINIFAGITELGEFSRLLVAALGEAPQLKVPVVARLVGNGLPAAREVLAGAGIQLYTGLDDALEEVRRHLDSREAGRRMGR
ncbi:MAG TPA: ATP-grasp domain-containing protein [Burkholderiales bacterium]|nr:ATP-grasp domain-containing protein [Burkholderiales bacterium]